MNPFELRYDPDTCIWNNLEEKVLFCWAQDDDPHVLVDELNKLSKEKEELEKMKLALSRLVSHLLKYSNLCSQEIKEDIFDNEYYDLFWTWGGTFDEWWEDNEF